MSSIIRNGDTFHGISVFGRGVFTNDEYGWTYAGQIRDGYACGLGVATESNGTKGYAEYGPDGEFDGRYFGRIAHGDTGYWLYERGEDKEFTHVSAGGRCVYNGVACAPDDPRLLALIAQVAPVEVRHVAPAHSPPTRAQAIVRWIGRLGFAPAGAGGRRGHRGAHPRRTPSLVVARHNPTTATLQSTNLTVTRARAFSRSGLTGGAYPLAA
jgi:hypothetical protein